MSEASPGLPLLRRPNLGWRDRLTAAGIHLGLSLTIAALAAILVFLVWYPGAFRELAGGRGLFVLLTSVDVVLGPLLTLAVFDRTKSRRHLRLDLAVIGALQLAALVYGLHTVFIVRPVAMIFEVDRMRLVVAGDVAVDELPNALPAYRSLPLTGPLLLGARAPSAGAEHNDALFQGLAGKDIGVRPTFWQPYEESKGRALARSRPIAALVEHYPEQANEIRQQLKDMEADAATSRYLPAMARTPWTAVLDNSGNVLGYLPFDAFF